MKIQADTGGLEGFFERLRDIYAEINRAYAEAAGHYGFSCRGCTDNCCTQRFFHHTAAEYLYLLEGVKTLDGGRRRQVLGRARAVTDTYAHELRTGRATPLMCPLNFDGLCCLYEYRPMICRAHGLPHAFRRPDGRSIEGGGCRRFEDENETDVRIDRTGFYTALAELERDLRARIGYTGRFRKTTAQMLMDMAGLPGVGPEPG